MIEDRLGVRTIRRIDGSLPPFATTTASGASALSADDAIAAHRMLAARRIDFAVALIGIEQFFAEPLRHIDGEKSRRMRRRARAAFAVRIALAIVENP